MPEEGPYDGKTGTLVPRHEYGKTGISMPVISIGGFMSLAVTVMHSRTLRKRMCLIQPLSILCKNKAMPWVMVNAILMPIVLIIVAWATPVAQLILSEDLMPKWAACLICSVVTPAVWVLFTQVVFGCSEHPYHNDRLLDYSLSLGINHIETARHCECQLRAAPALCYAVLSNTRSAAADMESEGQLRPTLKKRRDRNEDWIIQTKIRPYKVVPGGDPTKGALYQTAVGKDGSFETLGMADTGVKLCATSLHPAALPLRASRRCTNC